MLVVSSALLAAGLVLDSTLSPGAAAGADPTSKAAVPRGDATRGRMLFNGQGICAHCHGTDGHLDRRPDIPQETAMIIAGLKPAPSDLRNPTVLRERTDRDRFRTIRDGHSGTGMFPDSRLSDQDIRDLLAYLAVLRREGNSGPAPPP